MRGIVLAASSCALLCGCVSAPMNNGLSHLIGQPIHSAIGVLGYPSDEREIAGDTVYTWGGRGPTVAVATGNMFIAGAYYCVIQLGTGPDGVIRTYSWRGNPGGCAPYARALSR